LGSEGRDGWASPLNVGGVSREASGGRAPNLRGGTGKGLVGIDGKELPTAEGKGSGGSTVGLRWSYGA
jgi:hypothetical protein